MELTSRQGLSSGLPVISEQKKRRILVGSSPGATLRDMYLMVPNGLPPRGELNTTEDSQYRITFSHLADP